MNSGGDVLARFIVVALKRHEQICRGSPGKLYYLRELQGQDPGSNWEHES